MVSGDFQGHRLVVDPKTGYLDGPESGLTVNPNSVSGFSPAPLFKAAEKTHYVDLFRSLCPNHSAVCKQIGITRETFKNHYELDIRFRADIDAVRAEFVDRIEAVRFEVAAKPSGVMDRMAVLNADRKETYDPDKVLTIKHEMTRDEATQRAARLRESIDTEAVDAYDKTRTQQRVQRAKELKKLKGD